MSIVEDLSYSDDDADADTDNEKNEWARERGHVNATRFVDVEHRVDVCYRLFYCRYVPTLATICEPTTLQCLVSRHVTQTTAASRAVPLNRLMLSTAVFFTTKD